MQSSTWIDIGNYWPLMLDGVDISKSQQSPVPGKYFYIHYVISPNGYNACSKTKYKFTVVEVKHWSSVKYGYYFTSEDKATQALMELKEFHRKTILSLLNREIKKALKVTNKHGLDPEAKSMKELLDIEKIINYSIDNS